MRLQPFIILQLHFLSFDLKINLSSGLTYCYPLQAARLWQLRLAAALSRPRQLRLQTVLVCTFFLPGALKGALTRLSLANNVP